MDRTKQIITNAWEHYEAPRLDTLKVRDALLADDCFTCIKPASVLSVLSDEHGLYVRCHDGNHYLDGQLREDGTLSGFVALPPITGSGAA